MCPGAEVIALNGPQHVQWSVTDLPCVRSPPRLRRHGSSCVSLRSPKACSNVGLPVSNHFILPLTRFEMLQLVQHVTTPALFGGMTDVVQRRPSKNRFAWFLGAEKNVPTQPGKLSKAPSRRGIVSGPRKMGQQRASSMDGPDFKDASIVASEASLVTPLSTKASELAFRERLDGNANVGKKESFMNEYAFSRPPAWATKSGEWSVIAVPDHPRYEIHEPMGPTWYINHHLRPPPTAHPRTSFPPTPYVGNSQTQSSGSSSAASKPTRPRQYNDIVDSLDVSDPHGARWHHASPYELPRAASTRPKSQFVGPGVGTYAGPIEGSEPVEAVCHQLCIHAYN